MEKHRRLTVERQAKWLETLRKVAVECFNKPFKYLTKMEESKVKRIAYNRLNG